MRSEPVAVEVLTLEEVLVLVEVLVAVPVPVFAPMAQAVSKKTHDRLGIIFWYITNINAMQ